MLHDTVLHWLLWYIWSVYPAGINPSGRGREREREREREEEVWIIASGMREEKRNREGRVNRKLQSLEGQQDVPYLAAALIKDLGRGNVITGSVCVGGGVDRLSGIESDECNEQQQRRGRENMLHNVFFFIFHGFMIITDGQRLLIWSWSSVWWCSLVNVCPSLSADCGGPEVQITMKDNNKSQNKWKMHPSNQQRAMFFAFCWFP